ncbi:MAG: C2H2-type zinc finger protein [Chloroflexi bacterium]|nr:C2H2-type zinc finger protein [Chloroflexota bacterium]
MVTLYCKETPGLKLGPGIKPGDRDIIEFKDGYADLDPADPAFAEKMSWVTAPGTPPIRILDADEVPLNTPDAVFCPECGKPFATDRQLNGHLIQHRRKE